MISPAPTPRSAASDQAQTIDPQTLAEMTARAMTEHDGCTQALGMRLEAVGPGQASLSMTVRAEFLNGHRTCHGGMIFALADSAFAFACNTDNHVTVAAGCSIEYLRPAFEGQVLRADARMQARAGRQGVCDVAVSNDKGEMVAMFRGKSTRVQGPVAVVPGTEPSAP